jgi:hypothetical protein
MDHPTDRDYRNLEERNAAYWREQADKLAEALTKVAPHGENLQYGSNVSISAGVYRDVCTALAEYNASK